MRRLHRTSQATVKAVRPSCSKRPYGEDQRPWSPSLSRCRRLWLVSNIALLETLTLKSW